MSSAKSQQDEASVVRQCIDKCKGRDWRRRMKKQHGAPLGACSIKHQTYDIEGFNIAILLRNQTRHLNSCKYSNHKTNPRCCNRDPMSAPPARYFTVEPPSLLTCTELSQVFTRNDQRLLPPRSETGRRIRSFFVVRREVPVLAEAASAREVSEEKIHASARGDKSI